MSTQQTKLPLELTGGCLCGAIRYTVTIPKDSEWPLQGNSTCQCTQCRKFTGAPIPQGTNIPTSYISPPFSCHPTYKSYKSSEKGIRSFCSTCGSSLTFTRPERGPDGPETTEIMLGTFDEEVLCGKLVDGERVGGEVGIELCRPQGHIWMANAVKGVTDILPTGKRYWGDRGVLE